GAQAIADAGLSQQVARTGHVLLQLLAEVTHVHAKVLSPVLAAGSPGRPKELGVGHDAPSMAHERREELEFDRSEVDLVPGKMDQMPRQIDAKLPHFDSRLVRAGSHAGGLPEPHA